MPDNRQIVAGSIGLSLAVGLYALLANGPSPALLMGLLFVIGSAGIAIGFDIGGVGSMAFVGGAIRARWRALVGIAGVLACIGAVLIAERLVAGGG